MLDDSANLSKLRSLVERAKAPLGGHYEKLEAQLAKGTTDPHRPAVLIARAEETIDKLEQEDGFELTPEYAVGADQLDEAVPLLEEAPTIPGLRTVT